LNLLGPAIHLTQPSWADFARHVLSHRGWAAKRRRASEAEKLTSGGARKSQTYWVDVAFDPVSLK